VTAPSQSQATTGSCRADARDAATSQCRIICGDNADVMHVLPSGCCDLIYADPPFDVAGSSGGGAARHTASGPDTRNRDGLLDFLRPRLIEMHRLLSDKGSLYVHLDWRTVHHVKVMLDGIFGPRQFLNEIIWSYRSGSRPSAWFARKHDTILLYAKEPGRHVFNRQRGGSYRTRDLLFDADGGPYKSTRNGPVRFHRDGPVLTDVWDIPILSTVARERTGYPSQKPEALLARIVLASSNEGDVVGDFFCGSGTTCVAAKRLKRRWLGCDIDPDAVAITTRRLDSVS